MQLIKLFNAGFDHARQLPGGNWQGTPDAKTATHALVCSRWNVDEKATDPRKVRRHRLTRPEGYALAVCAVPLRKPRPPTVQFRRAVPPTRWPIYEPRGSLAGKRRVLIFIAKECLRRPSAVVKKIKALPNAKCDALYRSFWKANMSTKKKRK